MAHIRIKVIEVNLKRILLLATGLTAFACPAWMAAQTTSAPPSFEVATIKPSDPNMSVDDRSLGMSDDKFEAKGQTLKEIMRFAYNLNMGTDQQIIGGPDWIGTAKFDIDAKIDFSILEAWKKMLPEQQADETRKMVKILLEKRFQLKVHHDMKDLPIYALTVVKGGAKMRPSVDAANGTKPEGWSGLSIEGRGLMEGRQATTEMLSNVLGRQTETGGRLVLDKTELAGKYDFLLKWAPNAGMDGATSGGDVEGPSLFTALQEELGLKLEAAKGMVGVIVIDSVEKPSEN